ncbi:uncharacterized protein SPSK_09548 [Sporothrix schenckii 1099-18]|uniref:Uncharacterized protein n=1 Tax=Sporothrix schenckii 1099-18 TaxID=1397361 RepID=A0A0F2M9H2_SPOSC|nr:uncharacterized protein SPSK_09548 [Sporothrix schenckii 1099-18]KJR85445.1 hypothetical protein SPSK_09548 [Sporothrix schenckii 1099-18]
MSTPNNSIGWSVPDDTFTENGDFYVDEPVSPGSMGDNLSISDDGYVRPYANSISESPPLSGVTVLETNVIQPANGGHAGLGPYHEIGHRSPSPIADDSRSLGSRRWSMSSTSSTSSTFDNVVDTVETAQPVEDAASNVLPCEFAFTDCDYSAPLAYDKEWASHHLSHLKGKIPNQCSCWFCGKLFNAEEKGRKRETNFERRMLHISNHYREGDFGDEMRARSDLPFLQYLYRNKVISKEAYAMQKQYEQEQSTSYLHDDARYAGDGSYTGDGHYIDSMVSGNGREDIPDTGGFVGDDGYFHDGDDYLRSREGDSKKGGRKPDKKDGKKKDGHRKKK